MKTATERMDVLAAYREVGSYRGAAAAISGSTHKTVRRIVVNRLSCPAEGAGELRVLHSPGLHRPLTEETVRIATMKALVAAGIDRTRCATNVRTRRCPVSRH